MSKKDEFDPTRMILDSAGEVMSGIVESLRSSHSKSKPSDSLRARRSDVPAQPKQDVYDDYDDDDDYTEAINNWDDSSPTTHTPVLNSTPAPTPPLTKPSVILPPTPSSPVTAPITRLSSEPSDHLGQADLPQNQASQHVFAFLVILVVLGAAITYVSPLAHQPKEMQAASATTAKPFSHRVVGWWICGSKDSYVIIYRSDGTFSFVNGSTTGGGRYRIQDNQIFLDYSHGGAGIETIDFVGEQLITASPDTGITTTCTAQ